MPTVNDKTSLSLCDQPKFADIFKLPYNLKGYFDYNQALECARKLGKPIFVDFVGHTCANCKDMEARVWSDPRVLERLSSSYIIVALYVDDRTELPENEWVTSTRDGKIKKNYWEENADFQATRFNVNGQPYYELLWNQRAGLTEPMGYNTNVEEFVAFLDKGVEEFKKSTTGE
jgi:thiol:disulfide interchange protein DsbD